MNLHEHQAKKLLVKYGIKTPRGEPTDNPKKAAEIFTQLNISKGAVKSQIHSGGRGKAGGIKIVTSPAEAEKATTELIGKRLITNQTGPAGKIVRKVLIEESLPIEKELYLGMVIDRKANSLVLMASAEGGMEIEELARKAPEKILKYHIHPHFGLQPYQARELVYSLGICQFQSPEAPLKSLSRPASGGNKCKVATESREGQVDIFKSGVSLFISFSKLFIENDCGLVEINPLIVNPTYGLVALDAKINLDDRGLFRHKELLEWHDINEEDPLEYEASKHELSYIGLDGNIGCMVNGAGLAMATMDLIKLHGGEPANFLDVGGGASTEQVAVAFKLLLANKNVKAVLVNIFGGIMKCDVIAQGIVNAVKDIEIKLPLVVRLEGTNIEIGKKILKESGLNIISADTMNDAAKKVVQLSS